MENISNSLIVSFVMTSIVTVWLFYKAANDNNKLIYGILAWTILISWLGLSGFYQVNNVIPPRFIFLLLPGFLLILLLFLTKKGKEFIDSLNLKWMTILHSVRIPVELILYFIFLSGLIPVHMTFDGYNYDIIPGVTAPIVYYLFFVKKVVNERFLLFWNFLSLGLLLNILTIAVLSAQTPFQMLAFDQPNIGVTYFPFIWLPGIIVPIVLLSMLASIRQLLQKRNM